MKCLKCGKEFEGDYCPNCGTKAKEQSEIVLTQIPNEFTSKTIKKKPFYFRWWFFGIVVLIVACFDYFIFGFNKGEMIDWYEANGQDVKNWTLRFAQLLGIPGDTDYGQFTAFWAHPKDVIRPAYETDVASQVKNDYGLVSQDAYKEWFDANILWSYFESEYPWTRLGYTYDWSGETSEYGLTEFLLFDGETSQVEFTLPTLEFVNWLEDQTTN